MAKNHFKQTTYIRKHLQILVLWLQINPFIIRHPVNSALFEKTYICSKEKTKDNLSLLLNNRKKISSLINQIYIYI